MSDNGNRPAPREGRGLMIEAIGLSKHFGQFAATKDVSFTVPRGQVAAFLGPNGAGKSTTMRLLTGYLAPTTGEARIAGFNVATDRIAASRLVATSPKTAPSTTR
jgi:ABC-2 type transport system ATP-binding protein